LAALNDFAATLPEDEKTALETNHEIFNRTFDKVAAHYRPPSQPPRINRKDIDKTLRRHEALVESARSLPSGVAPESTGDPLQWKELDTLKRRARRGHRDSEVQMARMLFVDGNDI
jgi:hypothetical protein